MCQLKDNKRCVILITSYKLLSTRLAFDVAQRKVSQIRSFSTTNVALNIIALNKDGCPQRKTGKWVKKDQFLDQVSLR